MATVLEDAVISEEPAIVPGPLMGGLDPDWSLADLQQHLGGIPLNRIRLFPSPGLATEQHFLDLLDRKGSLPELIDGILVEKPLGHFEAQLEAILMTLLGQFVLPRKLGVIFSASCPIRLFPNLIRMPDITFISWPRFPGGKLPSGQILEIAPELAVEVISPSNTKDEMDRKVKDYFRAGTRLVWYVYPETQSVRVFHSPTDFLDLTGDQILDGSDVLVGFQISVKSVFELAQ
jgi:Uma2 family endonuclease